MHPDLCSHETCKLIGTSDKTSGRQHKQFLQVRAQVVCYRNRVAGHGGNDRTSNICLDPSQWDRPTTTGEHRKQASLTPTLDVHKVPFHKLHADTASAVCRTVNFIYCYHMSHHVRLIRPFICIMWPRPKTVISFLSLLQCVGLNAWAGYLLCLVCHIEGFAS